MHSGNNVLAGLNANIRLCWLNQKALELPVRTKIPPRALAILDAQPELIYHLEEAVQAYMKWNALEGGDVLQIYTTLAVPAGPGNRFGNWPLYARAIHSFHGEPYYSDVALQMEEAGAEEVTKYGQLRSLFRASFIETESTCMVQKDLALLRMYSELPASRLSKMVKCKELTWVVEKAKRQRQLHDALVQDPSFLVVDIANILRVFHIVPNFVEEDHFFINKYKF